MNLTQLSLRVALGLTLSASVMAVQAQGFYGSYEDYYNNAGVSAAIPTAPAPARVQPAPAVQQPAQSGAFAWLRGQSTQAMTSPEQIYTPQRYAAGRRTRSWQPPENLNTDHMRPEDLYGYYYPRYANVQVRDSAPDGELSSSTPIEIWLSQEQGRFGPYTFHALGGTRSDPTPTGRFNTVKKVEDYVSRKFDTDMPYAVFFTEACAIHVGSQVSASHGCIHVDWEMGELMYRYAKPGRTPIIIHP